MCNRLCMIMFFKCPIANKIQRSPFQNKPPLGTPASPPPLCEAAFSWDPSQMIHRCLPHQHFRIMHPGKVGFHQFIHDFSHKMAKLQLPLFLGICWPFWVESKKFFTPIATISYSPETWWAFGRKVGLK